MKSLSRTKINRISLGIQTLNDDALKLMKRVHSSKQSIESIENSLLFFNNLSIDLIYGIPNSDLKSLDKAITSTIDQLDGQVNSYRKLYTNYYKKCLSQ